MADKIIVVDSNPESLDRVNSILSGAGMHVTTLSSGEAVLDKVRVFGFPDLFLVDTDLPDMDGFEMMTRLREHVPEAEDVPVIFLLADENRARESEGLRMGAMDIISKPLDEKVLIGRVERVLSFEKKLHRIEEDALMDQMTGFWNKMATTQKMTKLCQSEDGFLCLFDLDSFKAVNDIYGHDVGDQILILFSRLLVKNMAADDVCGRIGGDEFIVFSRGFESEEELEAAVMRINETYLKGAKEVLGENMALPLGVSAGAVAVPAYGINYSELFQLADQSLRFVKENGKHGFQMYSYRVQEIHSSGEKLNLDTITSVIEERSEALSAMWMGKEAFGSIYRYMVRYMSRYHGVAYRVLFTNTISEPVSDDERAVIMAQFRNCMSSSLRNSDIMMECGENQLFFLLPEVQEYDVDHVISRLISRWKESPFAQNSIVTYEYGQVQLRNQDGMGKTAMASRPVVVLNGDEGERKHMMEILGNNDIAVAGFAAGTELIDFLNYNKPELFLMDFNQLKAEDFETIRSMRRKKLAPGIPIIFLIQNINSEEEALGLQMGATDFLEKPVIPEILILRVHHVLDLVRYQHNMSETIERKQRESDRLSLSVVYALARTIDARDTYTNGHSTRVAAYTKEIARRYGYTRRQQDEIFMMGLLHDVGKIGVPDRIISKEGPLTEEEYRVVQSHSVVGASILENIEEMPRLAEGARWHHERYDGQGYPDHLAGTDIPEQARIIAVADAYEAMSSRRSYRGMLSQPVIREEIVRCRGTQFDPVFADIMLDMIDEDKDFTMRE